MRILADTGVLLRAADIDDPQHLVIAKTLMKLIAGGTHIATTIQNVAEFWNVATRPRSGNGLSLSTSEAQQLLEKAITPQISVIMENDLTYDLFFRLLVTYNIAGKQVHDTRLVATAIANGVTSILTLNAEDFRRFEPQGIQILTPADVLASG